MSAHEAFLDWAEAEAGDTLDGLLLELLRLANEEDGQPHRSAMLASFSDHPEIRPVTFWFGRRSSLRDLGEHGSLDGPRHWQERRRAEDHDALLAQLERNREAAEAWQRASHDAAAVGRRTPMSMEAK